MKNNIKNVFTGSLLHFSALALAGCSTNRNNIMSTSTLSRVMAYTAKPASYLNRVAYTAKPAARNMFGIYATTPPSTPIGRFARTCFSYSAGYITDPDTSYRIGNYVGNCADINITPRTASTVTRRLVRKYSSSYIHNSVGPIASGYVGPIVGDHIGDIIGNYAGTIIGDYAGDFVESIIPPTNNGVAKYKGLSIVGDIDSDGFTHIKRNGENEHKRFHFVNGSGDTEGFMLIEEKTGADANQAK